MSLELLPANFSFNALPSFWCTGLLSSDECSLTKGLRALLIPGKMLVCVIWKCSAWGLLSVPRLLLCGCKMTRLSALLFGLKIQLKSLWEKSLMNGLKSLNFFLPCYGEKKNTSTLGGLLCEQNWAPQKTMQIHDSIYLDRQTLLEFNGRRVCLAMIRRYKRHCLKLVKFAFEESSEIPLLWTSGSQMNFELASHFRSLLFPLFADGQNPACFCFWAG